MPRPTPRRGISILGLASSNDRERNAAVGILERRLKDAEALLQYLTGVVGPPGGGTGGIAGLFDGIPSPVAAAGSPGTGLLAARGTHAHAGVSSITKSAPALGAITLTGAGVTQLGASFDIPGVGAAVFGTPVDVGRANAAGVGTQFVRDVHVHRGYAPLFADTTQTGNTAATETDLFSSSIPAGALAADGDVLAFMCGGTIGAGVSADKRLRAYFGASNIFDSSAFADTSLDWMLIGRIIRVGATVQKAVVQVLTTKATLAFPPIRYRTPAETLSGAVTLRVTGFGTNANDLVGEMWTVGFWPGP